MATHRNRQFCVHQEIITASVFPRKAEFFCLTFQHKERILFSIRDNGAVNKKEVYPYEKR